MASSTKRQAPEVEEAEAKRAKLFTSADPSESKPKLQRVVLNPADCDLDFNIEENGLLGHALYEKGFAYCWSGARANVGITGGKYCFGCKIIAAQTVVMEDTPHDQQHVCRLGLSRGDDILGRLGETAYSYGFGGTGKISHAGQFSNYGVKFGVGDTVVCAVNLESKPLATVGFSKNGKWLGTAKSFNAGPTGLGVVDSPLKKLQWESALFPHVLLKNVVVQLQFCVEDGLAPEEGYKPWASAFEDGNAIMGPSFCDPNDCEVMMMVGLPASGKTTWAEKWIKDHPEKRYSLLGTNLALDQMKVPGLLRKHNYGERFEHLMERATGIFNTLLSRAVRISRNYIIDQTNVYRNARNRKTRPFTIFQKIAVVIFPRVEELMIRSEKRAREMGKAVPPEAVNEMLANYVLPMSKDMPGSKEYFDQVMFPELKREDAEKCLEKMKFDLRSASNLNNKGECSPFARQSSLHSDRSHSLLGSNASSVTGRQYRSPQPPTPLSYGYRRYDQVSSPYQGIGVHGRRESFGEVYKGSQIPPRPSPYETHSSFGTPHPRNNSFNFNSSPGYDPMGGPAPYSYDTMHSSGSSHTSNPPDPHWNSTGNPPRRESFETARGYGTPLGRTPLPHCPGGGLMTDDSGPRYPRFPSQGPGHESPVWNSLPMPRPPFGDTPNMPPSGGYPGRLRYF